MSHTVKRTLVVEIEMTDDLHTREDLIPVLHKAIDSIRGFDRKLTGWRRSFRMLVKDDQGNKIGAWGVNVETLCSECKSKLDQE